jgi:hypothetical protein
VEAVPVWLEELIRSDLPLAEEVRCERDRRETARTQHLNSEAIRFGCLGNLPIKA